MTSDLDRQRLLRIARESIVSHVTGRTSPPDHPASGRDGENRQPAPSGAFVTIHRKGDLRGCIGHLGSAVAQEPVERTIRECAIASCSADPRFEPVSAAELPELEIEISLLGPLEPLASADGIEIGRHGLVVEQGPRRGLLLPQVATEWKWDPETFLAQTCHKAGLPKDAWKRGARLFRFVAEVFSEPAR